MIEFLKQKKLNDPKKFVKIRCLFNCSSVLTGRNEPAFKINQPLTRTDIFL